MKIQCISLISSATNQFGDLALADALRDVNIEISRAWPMIQGETPASLDYTSESLVLSNDYRTPHVIGGDTPTLEFRTRVPT